jgi:hypothetical protein
MTPPLARCVIVGLSTNRAGSDEVALPQNNDGRLTMKRLSLSFSFLFSWR